MRSVTEQTYTYRVSGQTRKEVWDKCHSVEYAERYYQLLGGKFLRHHRSCSIATIALGGGAVIPATLAVLSDATNAWIGTALGTAGALVAVVSVVSLVGDFARKASVSTGVARTCGRAARELRWLLNAIDLEQMDEESARAELARLANLVENETYNTEAVGILVDNEDKDSVRAERETRAHLEALYAA